MQGDTHNCGHCAHDCLGGQCLQASCQPVAVIAVDAGAHPDSLAQDDTYLYWADLYGTVSRTSKASSVTVTIMSALSQPRTVAVDDEALYVGDDNGVWRGSKSVAAMPAHVTTPVSLSGVSSVAVDDAGLYWSRGHSPTCTPAVHKNGTLETGSASWAGDAGAINVASDGQRVYATAFDGQLHLAGVDGGSMPALGTQGASQSVGVALNGGAVYWTVADQSAGSVEVASTTAATPQAMPLAIGQQNPDAVASDGVTVYWSVEPNLSVGGTSQILSCAIGSCSMTRTVLAQGFNHPSAIVVDAVAVYWIDTQSSGATNNGSIWKLAK